MKQEFHVPSMASLDKHPEWHFVLQHENRPGTKIVLTHENRLDTNTREGRDRCAVRAAFGPRGALVAVSIASSVSRHSGGSSTLARVAQPKQGERCKTKLLYFAT
jgi:hypothetical protein